MGKKVVTLGEIMLRLSTPGNTVILSYIVVCGRHLFDSCSVEKMSEADE